MTTGVVAATTHLDRLVGECERRVKEVHISCGRVAFENKSNIFPFRNENIDRRQPKHSPNVVAKNDHPRDDGTLQRM